MTGKFYLRRIFLGMCLVLVGAVATATAHDWDNGDGNYNWYDANNWNPNSLPAGSVAAIDSHCDANNFVQINTANSTASCDTLTLGTSYNSGNPDKGYLFIGAGTLYTYGDQRIGMAGIGYVRQTGGENNNYATGSSDDLILGNSDNGNGTYELQGGTLWTHNEYIGRDGTGFFNQTGGTNHIGHSSNSDGLRHLRIGDAASGVDGTGTYRLAGTGELILENSSGNIYVGDHYGSYVGVGRFEWFRSGGLTLGAGGGSGKMIFDTYSSNNTLAIGYNYNVNDFLSNSKYQDLASNTLEVTNGATATCNVTNTPSVTHFRVGSWTGTGYFNMTAGSWSVTQNFMIGDSGTGYVSVSGGTLSVGNHTYLGAGTFDLSGTGVLNSGWLHIGNGGAGTFTQSGGTNNLDGIIYLGSYANGSGTYRFAGGTLQHATSPTAGWMEIGLVTNATGRFEWFSTSTVDLVQIKLGSGGTLAMGRDFTVGNLTSGALYGGTAPSGLDLSTLEITNGAKATHDNVSMTIKNLTVGSGTGSGTYTLSGASAQLTVASGGALRIGADGTGRLEWLNGTLSSPNMTLGSGATLAMGIDYTVSQLTSGSIYGGSVPQNLSQTSLEMVDSAKATQSGGSLTVKSLKLGNGSLGGGTYSIGGTSPALTVSGGSLRIGADSAAGRLEWLAGTLSSPNMTFGAQGTLAMGMNFNLANLANGGLYGGSAPSGLNQATLEVTNSATATQNSGSITVGSLRLGSSIGGGTYNLSGSASGLTIASSDSLRIGADGSAGRLEWFTGTLSSPNMILGGNATLAMGIDFNLANLTSGGLYGGSAPQNISQATLEITDGASATQNSGSVTVGSLRLGSSSGAGTYSLSDSTSRLTIASSDSLRIGADGTVGRLEWSAGTLSSPNMILGSNATLAMGFNFDMGNLTSGALYGGSAPQNLNQAALEISNAAATHVNGTTASINSLMLAATIDSASYTMSGGSLIVGTLGVGSIGTGTFTHTGGNVTVNTSLLVGMMGSSNGTYLLQGGSLAGSGSLTVRASNTTDGTFSGYGTVSMPNKLYNSGRIVADGLGTSRTLDLSNFISVSNTIENLVGQRHGWGAEDHGKLTLPSVAVLHDGIYNWGESPYSIGSDPSFDQYIDLVNSLQINIKGIGNPASLTGSLLATDNDDISGPFPTGSKIIGVWDLNLTASFVKANLTFRYDDYLAQELGINDENLLQVYHFHNGQWEQVTSSIDTGNKWIYANGITSCSQFAVGVVPEPSTIVLLATVALAGLLAWRRRQP
ncbi:MAG: PEP-CTERM sorting domain-containing protein [Thermoguttaceae bacterium]